MIVLHCLHLDLWTFIVHRVVLRFACIEPYFSVPWEPGWYALDSFGTFSGIASPVTSGISRSRLRLGTYAVLIVAQVPFRESAPARARTRDIAVTLGDGVILKEEMEGAMGDRGQGEGPWWLVRGHIWTNRGNR